MSLLFAPKRRLRVSRRSAVVLNAMNLLAPVLLGLAVVLIGSTKVGLCPLPLRDLCLRWGAILVLAALVVRLAWAGCIRVIRKRAQASDDEE